MTLFSQEKLNEAVLELTKSLGVCTPARLMVRICIVCSSLMHVQPLYVSRIHIRFFQEVNAHNEQTVIVAQHWNNYSRNVRFNLQNQGKLDKPV